MPNYKYVAKDYDSRTIIGNIGAENEQAVIAELRSRDLMVVSIIEVKKGGKGFSFRRKKVKADDLVLFSRQLATMVDAGIPILQALEALQEQAGQEYFKSVIATMREDIQLGSSMSAAFSKHPRVFDPLFVNMIKVGETGGVLSTILDRIAGYLEKSAKLRRKVISALTYPAVIVFMAIVITTLLLVKMVPTFAEIYSSFDQELPAMTQVLIDLSNFLKSYILFIIGALILGGFFLARWYRTEPGQIAVDTIALKTPIFGPILKKVAISRFSRTLAILLQTGVPILESLDIVGKTSGNKVVEKVVEVVKTNVREGESIAVPLTRSGVFPPMVTRMIAIGEKSGQLEKMLSKLAEFYEDQVDAAVASLTSIIEPVIIGVLGVIIGFIVIALFMPILNMSKMIGT